MGPEPLEIFQKHKYMALTTYRKSGAAVTTPVWFAVKENKIYLFTEAASGKIKRIRHTPTVQIAPCTMDGKLLGESFAGQAKLVGENEFAPIQKIFNARYGLIIRLFGLLGRMRKTKRIFVEITPTID